MVRTMDVDQAERLHDGYRYSFLLSSALIVVIEVRALQPTVQHTRHCDRIACYNVRCFFVMTRDDNSIGIVQSNVRSQHTRRLRRCGLARAERLRDGYRYSFLLSSALIHCCDRKACASAYCPAHSFEINAWCQVQHIAATYTFICRRDGHWREGSKIVVVIERGQHNRHSMRWGLAQAERLA